MLTDPNTAFVLGLALGFLSNIATNVIHQIWLGPLLSRVGTSRSLKKTKISEKGYLEIKRMHENGSELTLFLLFFFIRLAMLFVFILIYNITTSFIVNYTNTIEDKLMLFIRFAVNFFLCFVAIKNIIHGSDVYWRVKNFHVYQGRVQNKLGYLPVDRALEEPSS